jgi:hypothetical protein
LQPTHPVDQCQENARLDLLLSAYRELGLVGTLPGPFDDVMGAEFRQELFKRHQIRDLRRDANEGFLTSDKAFNVGIVLLDDKTAPSIDAKASALKQRGAECVVALTRLPRLKARDASVPLKSVDVVILGAVEDEKPVAAEKVGPDGPIMVSAAKQGQYLGIVEFHSQKKGEKWRFDDRREKREARVTLLTQRSKTLEAQISETKDQARLEFFNSRLLEIQDELTDLSKSEQDAPLAGNYMSASTVALSRQIPPNPEFEARLNAFEKRIPSLVAQCEANMECPSLQPGQPKFVGAESCRVCHSAAYDFWNKAIYPMPAANEKGHAMIVQSGHAKAWATLEGKAKTQDRSCVECHSTGFMQPGGYCKVLEVGALANVQCESCHGAGSLHASTANKRFIKREVPESTCRGCHHVPHIPTTESFVYSEKLERILGKGHGEAFLEKIKHVPIGGSMPENSLQH